MRKNVRNLARINPVWWIFTLVFLDVCWQINRSYAVEITFGKACAGDYQVQQTERKIPANPDKQTDHNRTIETSRSLEPFCRLKPESIIFDDGRVSFSKNSTNFWLKSRVASIATFSDCRSSNLPVISSALIKCLLSLALIIAIAGLDL